MQSVIMCAPIWSVTRRLWNGFQLPFAGCIFRQRRLPRYFPCPFLLLCHRWAVSISDDDWLSASQLCQNFKGGWGDGATSAADFTSLWASSAKRKLIYLSLRFGERILHIVRQQHLHTWGRYKETEREGGVGVRKTSWWRLFYLFSIIWGDAAKENCSSGTFLLPFCGVAHKIKKYL